MDIENTHMNFHHKLLLVMTWMIGSCISSDKHRSRETVETAMKYFDHLILTTNADSIALLFTPDGELRHEAVGRDSIRNFLIKFKDFKVLYQSSSADSIVFRNDTAILMGTYHQKTIVPLNDTVSVKGTFIENWIWFKGNGWKIKRMETHPL